MKKRAKITTTTLEADGARVQTVTREVGGEDDESEFDPTDATIVSKADAPVITFDEPVPFERLRDDLVKPREQCWGCVHKFCPQRRPGANTAYDDLWNTYTSNVDTMETNRLAELIWKQWQTKIYEPLTLQNKPCMFWELEMIIIHITHHMDSNQSKLKDLIQKNRIFLHKLSDSIMVNRAGRIVADTEQVKNFAILSKNMAELMKLSKDMR